RRVPMNSQVRALLAALQSRLRGRYVVSSTGETPLDSQNFMNRVSVPALGRARIENFHFHDLRHTFASRLVMKGVDIRTVQELLGPAAARLTPRSCPLSPAHLRHAAEKLTEPRTGTTPGTSVEVVEDAQAAPIAKRPSDRGNRKATRRNRTGDLLITNQLLYH